jgi:hypothetical protein
VAFIKFIGVLISDRRSLQVIAGVGLIPLNDDVTTRIRKTEEFKTLDEDIVRNFDTVLLTTMTIISKLHSQLKNSPFADAARMQVCIRCLDLSVCYHMLRPCVSPFHPPEIDGATPTGAGLGDVRWHAQVSFLGK